jgi:hypothetical protein
MHRDCAGVESAFGEVFPGGSGPELQSAPIIEKRFARENRKSGSNLTFDIRSCRRPLSGSPRDLTLSKMIVHLIDGTCELFRHFYGLRRFTRVKGSASRGVDRPSDESSAAAGALRPRKPAPRGLGEVTRDEPLTRELRGLCGSS